MTKMNIKSLLVFLIFIGFPSIGNAQDGVVTVEQDKDIEKLLQFKKDAKTVDLYKIQVYQGNHSGAQKAEADFMKTYSEWPVSMEYETPNYKIWVGNFRSRLEADKALLKIKKNYNNAFIFKPKRDKS